MIAGYEWEEASAITCRSFGEVSLVGPGLVRLSVLPGPGAVQVVRKPLCRCSGRGGRAGLGLGLVSLVVSSQQLASTPSAVSTNSQPRRPEWSSNQTVLRTSHT